MTASSDKNGSITKYYEVVSDEMTCCIKNKAVVKQNSMETLNQHAQLQKLIDSIMTVIITVSGSGISWAICKFAPRSRQITTPAK